MRTTTRNCPRNSFIIKSLYLKLMSDSPVVDWETIVHKNVRSKDMADVGNVDALETDAIVVITEGARGEYRIPKTQVEAFDGAEVFLKSNIAELKKYKV